MGPDWAVSQSSADVTPTSGSLMLENGASSGQIELSIIADKLSEVNERFAVTLDSVNGGADIDMTHRTSSFTIRFV